MESWLGYLGTVLLLVGVFLGTWRSRRTFLRTNQYGVEEFSSFAEKVMAQTKDGILGFASVVMVSSGILSLAFACEQSWGWIVLIPVYGIVLFALLGT